MRKKKQKSINRIATQSPGTALELHRGQFQRLALSVRRLKHVVFQLKKKSQAPKRRCNSTKESKCSMMASIIPCVHRGGALELGGAHRPFDHITCSITSAFIGELIKTLHIFIDAPSAALAAEADVYEMM